MLKKRNGGRMFFGVFFLLLGISILLKVVFHIDVPIIKSLFAIFLIYFGFKMLLGGFGISSKMNWNEDTSVLFANRDFKLSSDKEYNVVFGSSVLDFTDVDLSKDDSPVQVNCVFGEVVVYIKPETPMKIVSSTVFGEAKMPNDNMVAFGTLNYTTPAFDSNKVFLKVNANVVFGSVKFEFKK